MSYLYFNWVKLKQKKTFTLIYINPSIHVYSIKRHHIHMNRKEITEIYITSSCRQWRSHFLQQQVQYFPVLELSQTHNRIRISELYHEVTGNKLRFFFLAKVLTNQLEVLFNVEKQLKGCLLLVSRGFFIFPSNLCNFA